MAIPAAAAAAYRAAAQIATPTATTAIAPAGVQGGNFSDFLSGAIKSNDVELLLTFQKAFELG